MAQNDEKELVLGNKQLISLFFLAVALCGVFFALGYMIGHNTSKGSIASLDGAASGTADTARPAAAAPATESAAPVAATADAAPQPSDNPASNSQTYTQPARDVPASVPQQVAPAAPAVPASAAVRKAEVPAAVTVPSAGVVAKPEAGATYIQVTALHQADAQNLVKTLREQSLPAVVAESSKPDLFRVLVGPYHQTVDVADAKARLKGLGFANAFVQKQ